MSLIEEMAKSWLNDYHFKMLLDNQIQDNLRPDSPWRKMKKTSLQIDAKEEQDLCFVENYLENHRININIRQVF